MSTAEATETCPVCYRPADDCRCVVPLPDCPEPEPNAEDAGWAAAEWYMYWLQMIAGGCPNPEFAARIALKGGFEQHPTPAQRRQLSADSAAL